MRKNRWILLIVGCLLIAGCEDEKPRTELNEMEKKLLDSLYQDKLNALKTESNYECDALRDSLFQYYVDSIRELRLIEVEQIINSRIE